MLRRKDIASHTTPLPVIAPVQSTATINDLGRLSAEAVQAQYEEAAKSVEAMGNAVKDRIVKLEAALHECDADMKALAEMAASVREKGKLIFAQIEEANNVSKDIRTACEDFKKKVG
jgi:predicted LPLAT superfamily acyltransferase